MVVVVELSMELYAGSVLRLLLWTAGALLLGVLYGALEQHLLASVLAGSGAVTDGTLANAHAQAAGAPTINYGVFINTIIDFLIVAFVIFMIVRQMNKMKEQPAAAAPTTKECPYCFTQIPIPATRCPNCTSELK